MFGERLSEIRKDNGDRQEDLAEKLCVSKHTVSSWEQGKTMPPAETIKRICELYDISSDYLLGLIPWDIAYEYTRRQSDFTEEERAKIKEYEQFIIFQRQNKASRG